MSNTVITNYTDLNGPSTKADSSVVVIVNKDGSLSVDQNLLGTLIGSDGSQAAGISVVRVGHEGRPDDATDSESDDDKVPHVTLSVDSYYNEPNSIIKYDSGAEMLQSLRIETRENSLLGFQNDHCYTPLTSPGQDLPQRNESYAGFDDPVIEITHTPPPKPVPNLKKITILDQQTITKGKKLGFRASESPVIRKGKDIVNKPISNAAKSKHDSAKDQGNSEDSSELSSSSSAESIPDRDSDSDYKDTLDRSDSLKHKKIKSKPRILKSQKSKAGKLELKMVSKLRLLKKTHKKEVRERNVKSSVMEKELGVMHAKLNDESTISACDVTKSNPKQLQKQPKKEKKTPAHVTALLSDMTSLFSTPDVIRRVSTDNKTPCKPEKELPQAKKLNDIMDIDTKEEKLGTPKQIELVDKQKSTVNLHKTYLKQKEKNVNPNDKITKCCDLIPQLDDASLAQILQDTTGISTTAKTQPSISTVNTMSSPGLTGPLSPTLDLLGGLQPEEEGWTEDLLMHVAQLVESSPNLQEVIDKQVMDKSDPAASKGQIQTPYQQTPTSISAYGQTTPKSIKTPIPRRDPIEIVRRDGRVITLPPIEAPATRASKRKTQIDTSVTSEVTSPVISSQPITITPEPQVQHVSKQYVNKKLTSKKDHPSLLAVPDKILAESQDSWNSEDDPNRLWCICKQPHNNRFMICCDGCEDWFHGKCVNITKVMGQQMEEQGIEWRCPNCVKKSKTPKSATKSPSLVQKKMETEEKSPTLMQSTIKPLATTQTSKTICIVCKKSARASSIYCSDACILKHAQDSLGSPTSGKDENGSGKTHDKQKADSRVIVYERKSGRVLAGPNAPTPENLKLWLQKNPTFEVVRPGTLASFKPNVPSKKTVNEPTKIQTMLNFERIPRKSSVQPNLSKPQQEVKTPIKMTAPIRESKASLSPKTPVTPKSQAPQFPDTPRPSTSSAKIINEPRKITRTNSRSQSTYEKTPSVSPAASRRKDTHSEIRNRMNSTEPVRDNVRKALQEQLSLRMAESSGPKFNEEEIRNFANDTEFELHELFKDTGIKYKAKYRSLMFNIKDRKNQSLWQKLCERSITPKQLVRLSPEELASQELAQWRDKETKHQLELIKKTELDLLAASKTYVLKTHKGEEVMETKESVSTELDPNIAVEDLVPALNNSGTLNDLVADDEKKNKSGGDKKHDRKKVKDSKKRSRESRRESTRKSSRSSRRKSEMKDKEERTRRSIKRDSRGRSSSKDTVKDMSERSRNRSRSRLKSKRRSKSRDLSRSSSKGRARAGVADAGKHRSKSQENTPKSKHDSTDSELLERPKSAMMKEVHPEYDPHEPMITSAFSEEDLRKSRDDIYEDSYSKNAIGRYEGEYDPSKDFDLHLTSTVGKVDKVSETESDQEPTSTVDNSSVPVWNGCINMVDVARFYVAAHEVSGSAADLEEDLNAELEIVGRINPDTVWDYIGKMKRASNKDITILRLQAANDEEKMQYIALYSYLSSRNRLGVVKVSSTTLVKDFYIVPLPANSTVQPVLLPFDGPGLGEIKTHLLIAIVIRLRKKRLAPPIPKDTIPSKMSRESQKRSYTPPAGPGTGAGAARALPLPAYTSSALSTTVKDQIAASLAAAEEEQEAYSPGSSSGDSARGSPPPNALRNKMDELNRQIEEQKQQIRKMAQADSSVSENEAYSPSRPMTPPAVVPLADIALPSNLQEILATIKQRSETSTTDVDMRTLPLP